MRRFAARRIAVALGTSVTIAAACGEAEDSTSPNTGGSAGAATGGSINDASGSGGAAGTSAACGAAGTLAAGGVAGTSASGGVAGTSAAGGAGAGTGGTAAGASGTAGAGASDGGGAAGSPGCGSAISPGASSRSLDVGGVVRTYLLVTPASLDANTPAPIVLGFHGGSGTSEQASRYGLTGTEPALYVYPQALEFPGAGGVAWNVALDGNDYAFIDALLVELAQNHCVDRTRVFAAGQSNGAFFVNQLGCQRPDAFRAIAAAAGGGPNGRCTKGVAAMIVHGTADTTVRIEQGMYSRDYWLAANGCSGAASAPTDPAPCVRYTGCARPVLWCQHAGAHPFPSFAGAAMRQFFLSL